MVFKPRFRTLVQLFDEATKTFGPRRLFASKLENRWQWLSYQGFATQVVHFRRALHDLGLQRGDCVAIIANNSVKWAVACFACESAGFIVVPMYEAQAPSDWDFILRDCEARLLIVSTDEIYRAVSSIAPSIPSLAFVVRMNAPRTQALAFDSLLLHGASCPELSVDIQPNDTAFLIYTSGTTGAPKGVELSHSNIASNVCAITSVFPNAPEDKSLSFLPWAHVFGLTCELHTLIASGSAIAINSSVDKLLDELIETEPTILVSVPRVFNRIYDKVNRQIASSPTAVQTLFQQGLRIAAKRRDHQSVSFAEAITLAAAERLVFAKIKRSLGGRLRYAISGGSALSIEVAQFIDSLGITVFEGYGLTESSPVIACNFPGSRRIGSVGKVLPGCSIQIDHSAEPDAEHGELIAYGPNIMKGYHKRPDDDHASILPDGGLRTGDMGYVDRDGFVYITGRIKEQYKLENGKFVVPAPLEQKLANSPFIVSAYIHGYNRPYNVALIVPDYDALRAWARSNGVSIGLSDLEMATQDQVLEHLRLEEIGRMSERFKGYESIRNFALLAEDFTIQNGMLTPSLKLKRRKIVERYAELIAALYRQTLR